MFLTTSAGAGEPSTPAWTQELAAAAQIQEPAERVARHRALAARFPTQPEVQRACGNVLIAAGQTDTALAYWQRVLSLLPADAESADALANAFLRLGRVSEAIVTLRQAVAAWPDDARLHHALGTLLSLFHREGAASSATPGADTEQSLREALAEFQLAAQLAPANADFARAYAETFYLLATPDWDRALLAWQAVLALEPAGETDFANGHLARVSLRLRRPAAAREFLARLRDPRSEPLKTGLLRQAEKIEHDDNFTSAAPQRDAPPAAPSPNSNSIPSR